MVLNSKLLNRLEDAFVIFSLLYYTGTLNFLGGVSTAEDPALQEAAGSTLILSLIQYGILAVTFLLSFIHRDRVLYLVLKRRFLWALVFLILISFLWSPVPDVTQKRAFIFFGICLFGINISAKYTLREQLYLLACTAGLILLINLLFTLALPSSGIEAGEHAGAWRGVYSQKNVSSRMFVLCSMILLLAAIGSRKYRRIFASLLGLAIVLTILGSSKGALALLIVLFSLVPLFRALRSTNTLTLLSLIALFMALSSSIVLVIGNLEIVAGILGRDLTLTGRTGIWSVVINKISLHPWLGYGFKGFWRGLEGDSADVWYETFFMAPNAHNGFLDITVQLGLVGLFFFLLTYSKNYGRAIAWLRLNHDVEGLLPIMYLTFVFLFNLVETTIFDPANWVFVLYISITTTVLTQPIPLTHPSLQSQSNTHRRIRNV